MELLDELGIANEMLSVPPSGPARLLRELIARDTALARVVRRFRPAIMTAIGGTFIAHVGTLLRVPSVVFYDTENATLQNALTYPVASCVVVPSCYQGWVPRKRHIRYRGYHELAYLHPHYFSPNRAIAIDNGLAPAGDTFLIRVVSWQASHDVGETGWSRTLLRDLVRNLSRRGKVIISSESRLEHEFARWRYRGRRSEIHHVMAFCRAYIGESATMASECAVLGVPAILAASTGRGYTDEQEVRFTMVRNEKTPTRERIECAIDDVLEVSRQTYRERREHLLSACIDVSQFVERCVTSFPASLESYQKRDGAS